MQFSVVFKSVQQYDVVQAVFMTRQVAPSVIYMTPSVVVTLMILQGDRCELQFYFLQGFVPYVQVRLILPEDRQIVETPVPLAWAGLNKASVCNAHMKLCQNMWFIHYTNVQCTRVYLLGLFVPTIGFIPSCLPRVMLTLGQIQLHPMRKVERPL